MPALQSGVPQLPPDEPQPPVPLQVVCWHWPVAAVHAPCGSSPAVTGAQVPACPDTLQALQPAQPVGLVSQQTPSVQKAAFTQPPQPSGCAQPLDAPG